MYYGRENDIAVYAGCDFIGTYIRQSDYSKAIQSTVTSVLGFCPPFSGKVFGNKFCGTLKISFFNEFDNREIGPEKMRKIIAEMNASPDYEVIEEYISGTSLCVAYRKL